MKKPLKIGITGGIGSGKSVVCRMFSVLGIPVYDADTRAKYLMATDSVLIQQIKGAFGVGAYAQNGELDRQYLAKKVFHDSKLLQQLNGLVHPRVGEDYAQWQSRHSHEAYTLKEAALMIESGAYRHVDRLITVSAPVATRKERVAKRDPQRTKEQIEAIIEKQLSDEERAERADHVLINDETCLLSRQVLDLNKIFMKIALGL